MARRTDTQHTSLLSNRPQGFLPRSLALWMVVGYLALFIIRPWEKLLTEITPSHFERWYGIAMIVVVVASGRARLRFDLQTTAVLLFAFAMGVSGLGAGFPVRPWFVPYEYLTLVVFYFVLVSVVRTPYELLFVITCYVAIMTAYLAKSQWEYFVHGAGIWEMGVQRLQGIDATFGNDNSLAASVTFSIPFLYLLFRIREDLTESWPSIWRKLFLPFLVVYAGLAVTSVLLTRSRTGLVVLLFSGLLLGMRRIGIGRKAVSLIACAVLALVVFVVLPADMQKRIRSIWNPEYGEKGAQASAEGRWRGFQAGLIMFGDHPITGVGSGNFIPYRIKHVEGEYGGSSEAHNLIGELLGETGLLGAMTFALLVFATLNNCRRAQHLAKRARGQPVSQVMAQVALACRDVIILLFVFGIGGHNLERFNWLWVGAFCALAVGFSVAALDDESTDRTSTSHIRRN